MPASPVTTVDAGPRMVARRVSVNAPAAELFAIVADPHRHPELDGSGTVRDVAVDGPSRLSEGATFAVGMKQFGLPYTIRLTVVDFEDGRVVQWRHPGGHTWRWEMSPTGPSTTEVTERFDYSTAKAPKLLEILGQPAKNAAGIEATLSGLAARYA